MCDEALKPPKFKGSISVRISNICAKKKASPAWGDIYSQGMEMNLKTKFFWSSLFIQEVGDFRKTEVASLTSPHSFPLNYNLSW